MGGLPGFRLAWEAHTAEVPAERPRHHSSSIAPHRGHRTPRCRTSSVVKQRAQVQSRGGSHANGVGALIAPA
jgi:hypothetical protein